MLDMALGGGQVLLCRICISLPGQGHLTLCSQPCAMGLGPPGEGELLVGRGSVFWV